MAETQEKQQYLCDHILDRGLNPDLFAEYLQTIRNNGTDIDQWTFEELRIVVKNFQQDALNNYNLDYNKVNNQLAQLSISAKPSQVPGSNETAKLPSIQPITAFEQPGKSGPSIPEQSFIDDAKRQQLQQQQQTVPQQQQQLKGVDQIDENNYKKVITCVKSEPSSISEVSELKAIVAKYEKKAGGLFSTSYIVYQVQTTPLNSSVFRRYNDFAWLHSTLEKAYPQISIPPVPGKKSTRSFQPLFLSKRMAFMEKFLNQILACPELRQSKYIEGFLTMPDDIFAKLKKDGEKLPKTSKIGAMITQSGEAQCIVSEDVNTFLKKSNEYLGNQDIIYKKIRKLCNQLVIDFDQLSTTLFSIGDCFSQSYNLSVHYNSVSKDKNPLLEELYIHLNNMTISWGNNLTGQIKVVQENLSNWFKYYDNELKSVKEYLKVKEQAERDFQTFKKNLTQKKEKFFIVGDTSKWEIPQQILNGIDKENQKNKDFMMPYMFPKETIQQGELRDIYAFYNYSSYQEIKRIMKGKIENYSEHFNQFGSIQSDHIQEMHVQWADLMTNMQSMGGSGKVPTALLESTKYQNDNHSESQFVDD